MNAGAERVSQGLTDGRRVSRPGLSAARDEFRIGLTALGHPITLASVALLLLNDHVLKRSVPSALTGKLSDFAGLFFFPYLVIALASLARLALFRFKRGEAPPPGEGRAAGGLAPAAYLGSAILFAAIKASPSFSSGVSQLLASFLGAPIRITPDLTDLAALGSLWPSYRLWRSLGVSSARQPSRRSLLALGLAALATAATSPCIPPAPLSELVLTDHGLYGLASFGDEEGFIEGAYLSTDSGLTWRSVDALDLPAVVVDAGGGRAPFPRVDCVPPDRMICYRVARQEQVEASTDGGFTWQTVWSPAWGRREYMERFFGFEAPCGEELDLRAVDLVVTGEGEQHVVVVALGNEGFLRGRIGQKEWARFGLGYDGATPERGSIQDLVPPRIILAESWLAGFAGLVSFFVLSRRAWRGQKPSPEESPKKRIEVSGWVPLGMLIIGLVGSFLLLVNGEAADWVLPMLVFDLGGLILLILWLVRRTHRNWKRAIRAPAGTSGRSRQLLLTVWSSVAVVAVAWLPMAAWVLGWIPPYNLAALVSVLGAAAVLILAGRRIDQTAEQAP